MHISRDCAVFFDLKSHFPVAVSQEKVSSMCLKLVDEDACVQGDKAVGSEKAAETP
jgi:hypothetical protein